MGKCLFMRKGETHTAPVTGIRLGDIAEGSIVKLNESGSPVEFYVAKHDYESGLNGDGRTLLVRKNCYDTRQWNSVYKNAYASSGIDTWLNEIYKELLDSVVQTKIGTTKFYYTPGINSNSVTTLDRSIFQLSVTEFGLTWTNVNVEGSELPISSVLRVAYINGAKTEQWTRTPYKAATDSVMCLYNDGSCGRQSPTGALGSRPCFTLPSTSVFDEETLVLKGVK